MGRYHRHFRVAGVVFLLLGALLLAGCKQLPSDPNSPFRGMEASKSPAAETAAVAIDKENGRPVVRPEDPSSETSDTSAEPSSSEKPSENDSSSAQPAEQRKLSVLAVGDDLIHRGIYRNAAAYAKQTGSGAYDFKPIFAGIAADISAADLAIINQETMFDPEKEPSNYPNFNTPAEIAQDLADLGFDVISLANNHMLDVGSNGLLRTIRHLDGVENVTRVGAYTDREDMDRIRVIKQNGLRIAVVAFTYGTNGYSASDSVKIPYLTEENVRSQMALAADAAEFTMVIVHWGNENEKSISENQKKYAALFVECGADVIIGSHPHVLQPIEWLTASDGRQVLCAYSLGNLVSMMSEEQNMLGGILRFDICSDAGEHPYITNVRFDPTVYFYLYNPGSGNDWFENRIYYLTDFTEELAAKHGVRHYSNTVKLSRLYQLAKQQIAAEFLPADVLSYGS